MLRSDSAGWKVRHRLNNLHVLWFLVPGVLLAHRIGVLLHEYLHGIPFRNYRNNLAGFACMRAITHEDGEGLCEHHTPQFHVESSG